MKEDERGKRTRADSSATHTYTMEALICTKLSPQQGCTDYIVSTETSCCITFHRLAYLSVCSCSISKTCFWHVLCVYYSLTLSYFVPATPSNTATLDLSAWWLLVIQRGTNVSILALCSIQFCSLMWFYSV